MNLSAINVFFQKKMVQEGCLRDGSEIHAVLNLHFRESMSLLPDFYQICLCSSKHDVPHPFLHRGEAPSLSNEAECELR